MTLYLVRHGDAGSRSAWDGNDRDRPLNGRGRTQADGLRDRYRKRPIERVLSSPSVRCQQTVAPLAHAHGLDVTVCAPLDEGSPTDEVLALLKSLARTDAVLCSHGDVIPAVARALLDAGVALDRDVVSVSKAGTFELTVDGDEITAMTYVEPPPT